MQFLIHSYTSDEKSMSSKNIFLYKSILILSLCLDIFIFIFLLYTLWIISLIMKNRFIINMSIHKVYGPKIIEKFVYVKIKLISTHTKKLLLDRLFFIRCITMNKKLQYANEILGTSEVWDLIWLKSVQLGISVHYEPVVTGYI